MTRNAYLDESQRSHLYAVAAVAVEHRAVADVRRAVGTLAPRGISRRHFVREMDSTRRRMLEVFANLDGIEVTAMTTTTSGTVIEQRSRCLAALASDLVAGGVDRLVLDHVEDSQRRRDRRDLARAIRGTDASYGPEPDHSSEALLWIPDAVAWCVGRKGWRPSLRGWVRIFEV